MSLVRRAHRANGFDIDRDEIRLITQYPLNVF